MNKSKLKKVLVSVGFEPTTVTFKITESHTLNRYRYIAVIDLIRVK